MLILPGKIYGIIGVDRDGRDIFFELSQFESRFAVTVELFNSVTIIWGKVPSRPNFKTGKGCFHIGNVCQQVCILSLFICVSSFDIRFQGASQLQDFKGFSFPIPHSDVWPQGGDQKLCRYCPPIGTLVVREIHMECIFGLIQANRNIKNDLKPETCHRNHRS